MADAVGTKDVLTSHVLKLADLPSQRHGELLGTIGDRDICRDYFTWEFYSVRHVPEHLFKIASSLDTSDR